MQKNKLTVPSFLDHLLAGNVIVDTFGRAITYLPTSSYGPLHPCVAAYCMPKAGNAASRIRELLSFEKIIRIIKDAASCWISKVRLTDREPMATIGGAESFKITQET